MHCLKKLLHAAKNGSLRYGNSYSVHVERIAVLRNVCRFQHDDRTNESTSEDTVYKDIASKHIGIAVGGHKVFVLQPYIKWGRDKRRNTTPELQLSEAVALVNTLPQWSVADRMCVPLLTLKKRTLLGPGGLDRLKQRISSCGDVTAVFVSTNILRYAQLVELGKELNLPVYDRYSIVVQIFRQHAWSPEAKTQVALAEIPYIKKKVLEMSDYRHGMVVISEKQKLFLDRYEAKLKKLLLKLKEHRSTHRRQRKVLGFPTVAVVGYTNAGKTSLIRALTGDDTLQPRNELFATLDTTMHEGLTPCKMKLLYVDTIGFIQDIPESLIEPFKVTFEDAMNADVLVHVYDISHPDMEAQYQHIVQILNSLVDDGRPVIHVANKCDLVDRDKIPSDVLAISAEKSMGIDVLKSLIEKELLAATGRSKTRVRVQAGSPAAAWLYKQSTVTNVEQDADNPQYTIMDVLMSPSEMDKFKRFLKQ